jgi:hypothetical protein
MRRSISVVVALALFSPAQPLTAQTPAQVAQRYLDAVRAKDADGLRSLIDPTARVVSTGSNKGVPVLRSVTQAQFINSVMKPPAPFDKPWDQRIWSVRVFQEGNMAVVWAPYDFRQEGQVKYCGTVAIQLVQSAGGWRIFQLTESQRSSPCSGPPPRR